VTYYVKRRYFKVAFGKTLKRLRENKELKQEELAKIFNVERSTLGKWENDSSKPDYSKLNKIADYFNVTTDYLLGRTDDPNTVIIDNENLPHALKDLDAIEVVKGAFDKGFSKEDIKEMLEFMEKMNKKNDK
jgi:transcriptional regulator with XRE-family HTH domain